MSEHDQPHPPIAEELARPGRLAALEKAGLLDTPPEELFDRWTQLICDLLETPIALLSFVTPERQFFKSAQGLEEPLRTERQTALSYSFCQYVVASAAPLIVDDARENAMVSDSPAISELQVIAYLGVPVASPAGEIIGSLCAIDSKPRAWEKRDLKIMQVIATAVAAEIATREREYLVRQALTATRSGAWQWEIAGDRVTWSDEVGDILGIGPSDFPRTLAEFMEMIPEEDRPEVQASIGNALESGRADYEIECRMRRADGGLINVRGCGQIERCEGGEPVRVVGLVANIDALHAAKPNN